MQVNTSPSETQIKKLSNGNIIIGCIKGQTSFSGFGVMKETNNNTYYGEFHEEEYHGKGCLSYSDQSTYLGEFIKSEPCGLGQLNNPLQGYIYLGQFANGQINGSGVFKDKKNGSVRMGSFKDQQMQGFGVLVHKKTNYKYIGHFTEGQMDGIGMETNDKQLYIGGFSKGQRNGIGSLKESDKSNILCTWNNGMREGFGMEKLINGDNYDGDFTQNSKSGLGLYLHFNEKMTYTGAFTASMRSGFGRLESEQFIYVGGWSENLRNGLGYQTNKDGGSYFGYWKDDLRQGLGIEIGSGYEYKGEWVKDQPDGLAIIKIKNKGIKGAIFKNGNLEKYVDIEELQPLVEKLNKLNFDKYFSMAKEKLGDIDEYIESRKQNVVRQFKNQELDFQGEESKIKEKQKERELHIENVQANLQIRMNKFKGLSLEVKFDLFLSKEPSLDLLLTP